MRGESAALKLPEGNEQEVPSFVELLKAGGHVDFRQADERDYFEFWKWYNKEFQNLSKEDQTEYLEQFIITGIAHDNEILSFLKNFDGSQKKAIGEFLFKVAQTENYAQSFYECWESLNPELIQEIIEEYTINNPEHAFLIAPFVDLRSEIVEKFNGDIEKYYFGNMLDLYTRHPELWIKERILQLMENKKIGDELRSRLVEMNILDK